MLGHDHPALGGHMPFGHTTSTVASGSRHPVVAVPRGWTARADDRRPIAVAIDGLHPSSSTLDFAFTEASLRQVPVLVVHSAPLTELASGEQDTRLNLAEILAGWKTDNPDIDVETLLLAGAPGDTVDTVSADVQLLVDQSHQVDDVDDSSTQLRQPIAQDLGRRHSLHRHNVSGAGQR